MDNLNDKQLQAVKTTEGYIRVIAGPGSGKTRTIAHRFSYLVNDLGISSNSILALTFTNKAAKEMKNRIEALIDEPVGDFVCTFHSFCKSFLREEIYRLNMPKNFDILDESDCISLLKEIFRELKIPTTGSKSVKYTDALKGIRLCKKEKYSNYMEYLDDINRMCPTKWDNIFTSFIVKQRKYNKLDFSDLIFLTKYILNKYPEVLKKWSRRIVYVLVDESQDNSDNQWDIASKLSEINGNLFVVGDPDQSIYLWRGANPMNLVNMDDVYPNVETILLDINYRSLQSILTASDNLIKNNLCRVDKTMVAARVGNGKILWHHANSEQDEAKWIISKIKGLHEAGISYSDIAILYRSSYSSQVIEQTLMREKLPYLVYGGVRFFEREEIKDIIAYLKLIEIDDDFSFIRIINKPKRGLGPSFVDTIKKIAEEEESSLFEALCSNLYNSKLDRDEARKFCKFVKECRILKSEFPISDMVEYILDTSGIRETLKNNGDEERMENLKEFVNSIKLYEEEHEGEEITFSNYLQDIALLTNMDYRKENDNLRIMTIHQSKGLEFKNVFIFNLSEGNMPNAKALRKGIMGLEEERRLMYVAMTRAKDCLYLSDSEGVNRLGDAKIPSRFIYECKTYEMTPESVPVKVNQNKPFAPNSTKPVEIANIGDEVFHHLFERGRVVGYSDDGQSYQIEFEHSGFKIIKLTTRFEKIIHNHV